MQTPSKGTRKQMQGSEAHKYHQKCVCDICTCGKHTCPQKSLKFEGETTHNHYYKPYNVVAENPQRYAYNPEQKHYDPNLIQSTYNTTYTPHPLENPQHLQYGHGYGYLPNRGKFEDETEYKKNYIPTQISVDRPVEQVRYMPNSAKFEGNTTYNRQFSPKHGSHPEQSYRPYDYRPSNIPFVGTTTYDSEYKPHKIESYRPDTTNRYEARNAPFVGQSRYKEEYVPYKMSSPQVCATELLPSRPLRCSPGKQHLHFTATKNQWE